MVIDYRDEDCSGGWWKEEGKIASSSSAMSCGRVSMLKVRRGLGERSGVYVCHRG